MKSEEYLDLLSLIQEQQLVLTDLAKVCMSLQQELSAILEGIKKFGGNK